MNTTKSAPTAKKSKMKKTIQGMLKHWQFYLIISVPLAFVLIFSYAPMYGVLMAFQDFSPRRGVFGSEWVGLKHFEQFLSSPSSMRIIWNTLEIGIYGLIAGFPLPIILAVGLNECRHQKFKKVVQMVTYAPYFISTVVLVSIIIQLTGDRTGLINNILGLVGIDSINFMGEPELFSSVYVWSGIWQGTGYAAIIYIAALAGVSPELQEAAVVDGATKVQRIWNVDLPAIKPQIIILFIFNMGSIIGVGFEKTYLMQNDLNLSKSEVISTFVYKVGLESADYSFSTAVGLFNSLVSVLLLLSANFVAKKVSDTSLF